MSIPAKEKLDQLLYLARQMDDRTSGNDQINMDWGNAWIRCTDSYLKDLLVDLANDYVRLRKMESDVKNAIIKLRVRNGKSIGDDT